MFSDTLEGSCLFFLFLFLYFYNTLKFISYRYIAKICSPIVMFAVWSKTIILFDSFVIPFDQVDNLHTFDRTQPGLTDLSSSIASHSYDKLCSFVLKPLVSFTSHRLDNTPIHIKKKEVNSNFCCPLRMFLIWRLSPWL